jgi:hypothetical protein
MKYAVATIAVRRSHRFRERAQLVEHVAGPVSQVAADHVPGGQVDQVPVVDPVVAP